MIHQLGQYQALSTQFSQQLASLRGISAIIVLFSHCFQAFIAPFDLTLYSVIRLLGQAAVMMFFVLSGFLIGHSMQKNRQQFGQFNLTHYIKQRCTRILPPFIFALALTALLYVLAPYFFASESRFFQHYFGIMIRYEYDISYLDFIGSMLFLNGFLTPTIAANAALWSLSYEVWFYVLAGFFPFLFHSKVSALIFLLVLIGLSTLNIQFLIYFLIWITAFAFSFPQVQASILDTLQIVKIILLCLALAIACFDAYQFHIIYQTTQYTTENFTAFNFCIGLALACWLLQVQHQQKHYPAIWVKSADFSYTLYVIHFPLLLFILGCFPQTLSNGLLSALLSLILSMLVLIAVSWFISRWIEPQKPSH